MGRQNKQEDSKLKRRETGREKEWEMPRASQPDMEEAGKVGHTE